MASHLSIGIVGLPNVGKSTLFQALTKKQVDCSNYPFTTINPNVGVVEVPDPRVDVLAQLTGSARKIYETVEFVDIAGLVKGAHQGEGLGNQFLSHIRETVAIIYVLRAFKNSDIINTRNVVDPVGEKEILDTELVLKDMETVRKRIESVGGEARSGKKEAQKEAELLLKIKAVLEKGEILAEKDFSEEENQILKNYQLLSLKPRLCFLNAKEEESEQEAKEVFRKNNWPFLIVDVLEELGAAGFTKEERQSLGLPADSGLDLLIKQAYSLLNLITFFTTVSQQVQAWQIKTGTKLARAAGTIHTDFETHFIKAEVINYKDLVAIGSFALAREKGLIRTEGRDYVVQDGDVIEIKHGA
ncbi:MAG: redox-regulated ATPase YchF [bacterium]|nr:redox-regulated ATPase YchF [bacterium]